MSEYGMFYTYWSRDWEASLDELSTRIVRTREIGFDIIEIHCNALLPWSTEDRIALKEYAEEQGVDLSLVMTLTPDNDIASADPATRQRGMDQVRAAIEIADEVDAVRFGGIIHGAWNPTFDGDLEKKSEWIDRSVDAMKDVASIAEEHDVVCTVEAVNRFEQFMLNTAEETVEFVERVDSPYVEIMLDTYHMNIEEDDIAEAIITAGDQLGHFHIGENNRRVPREGGNLPWQEIGEALDEIDYDGTIVMEPFVVPDGNVAPNVGLWRNLADESNLDKEAEESLAFVKDTFER